MQIHISSHLQVLCGWDDIFYAFGYHACVAVAKMYIEYIENMFCFGGVLCEYVIFCRIKFF